MVHDPLPILRHDPLRPHATDGFLGGVTKHLLGAGVLLKAFTPFRNENGFKGRLAQASVFFPSFFKGLLNGFALTDVANTGLNQYLPVYFHPAQKHFGEKGRAGIHAPASPFKCSAAVLDGLFDVEIRSKHRIFPSTLDIGEKCTGTLRQDIFTT